MSLIVQRFVGMTGHCYWQAFSSWWWVVFEFQVHCVSLVSHHSFHFGHRETAVKPQKVYSQDRKSQSKTGTVGELELLQKPVVPQYCLCHCQEFGLWW